MEVLSMSETVKYWIEKRPEYWLIHAIPKCGLFDDVVIATIYVPLSPNPGLSLYNTLGVDGVQEILDILKEERANELALRL
jgi:hypothetical protein